MVVVAEVGEDGSSGIISAAVFGVALGAKGEQVDVVGFADGTFNLGGYQQATFATGSANRHEFGGLTDATFKAIPLLEAGRNADWPF